MNLLPDKQMFTFVPFQCIKYRKKELGVDNKVQETFGDVYYPTCRNEKCVYISNSQMSSFYDSQKRKTWCHVLKDQKPTILLSGGNGTHCFVKKTSRDYKNEKPYLFQKKFLRQSQSTTRELEPKKEKNPSNHGIIVSTSPWLVRFTGNSYAVAFLTLPVCSKAAGVSQLSKIVLKCLSALDQIQIPWLWKISSRKRQ